jgi:hypothetical protein
MEQDALWYMKEACSDDKVHKDGADNGGNIADGFDGERITVNRRGVINNGHLRARMRNHMSKAQQWESSSTLFDFAINASTMSLVYEPQMTSAYHGTNDIQFLHMANYVSQKMSYLAVALRSTPGQLDRESNYRRHMGLLVDEHYLHLDILGLAEQMEDHRVNGAEMLQQQPLKAAPAGTPPTATTATTTTTPPTTTKLQFKTRPFDKFPTAYEAKRDMVWHDTHVTFLLSPASRGSGNMVKNLGQTYSNYVIKVPDDTGLYLVTNGSRHAFPDFDTFVKMG